jgi:membrane glycosyltransferase
MALRRAGFALGVLATIAFAMALMVQALQPLGPLDYVMLVALACTLPWSAIGFWNSLLGVLTLRLSRDPEGFAVPLLRRPVGSGPLASRTAILFCIRNEEPDLIRRNIAAMLGELASRGHGDALHAYILSDSDEASMAAAEEAMAAGLERQFDGRIAVTYRRRTVNTGFKAGNIRDFCERWGDRHDFMVVLDADSFMGAEAILHLVRLMESDSRLGLLQTLVVGMPSTSAFARVFQFGMRLGMRSYTLGSTLWQADCGPYWGHNAIIRVKPFIDHCDLPQLRDGTPILSHDQVEGALMRRAGYEVRVLPVEGGSWEENPPTLLEFIRRDLRWCRGNMQYWELLRLPGLRPVSRYQFVFAILMFLNAPAWIAMVMLAGFGGPLGLVQFDWAWLPWVALALLLMSYAPKLASLVDTMARPDLRRAYGGGGRVLASAALETLFNIMLQPVMALSETVCLLQLLAGRAVSWPAQQRSDHSVPLGEAVARLWLHTLVGAFGVAWFAFVAPDLFGLALLLVAPLLLAVPFAVLSSWPSLGRLCARLGVGRLPEEVAVPSSLAALDLPAVALARAPAAAPSAAQA